MILSPPSVAWYQLFLPPLSIVNLPIDRRAVNHLVPQLAYILHLLLGIKKPLLLVFLTSQKAILLLLVALGLVLLRQLILDLFELLDFWQVVRDVQTGLPHLELRFLLRCLEVVIGLVGMQRGSALTVWIILKQNFVNPWVRVSAWSMWDHLKVYSRLRQRQTLKPLLQRLLSRLLVWVDSVNLAHRTHLFLQLDFDPWSWRNFTLIILNFAQNLWRLTLKHYFFQGWVPLSHNFFGAHRLWLNRGLNLKSLGPLRR